MSTETKRTCPSCGNEFSGAMEFCPVCMLHKGLAGGSESGESSTGDTLNPTFGQPVQRFEHYELLTGQDGKPVELGRGAMGVTYKAFDTDLQCLVTLKVISERYLGDESARLRFLREARAAAKVRHTNVASVLHLGRTGSGYFYAMEFVEGETLEHLIKRSGHLEVKLALETTTQVASGLAAVHKQKLVHRDIKPSNIMVSLEEGGAVTAKIIDLGLAKSLDEPTAQTAISTPGAFAGTPEFASPEQFAGVPVDIRSDLYSLGVTLWVMVTGKTPFRGTPGEVMHQHQHAPLPLEQLEDVPQPVVVLLEVLLEKDPRRRFQTPAELLKAIPTITGAIDAGRRITRQSLQKTLSSASRVGTRKPPVRSGPNRISVARLPVTGSDVFGRDEDIVFLDRAWANEDVNVVTIVAWAGVGKSTLVNHWLRRMAADHYRSAELVFGWSFYRQGAIGGTSSSDEFLDAALAWFGDPDPRLGTAWEKGERLAKLIAHHRTLLVLDGLEPLQNPPGPQEGRLREPSVQALLRELAAFNTGLCVITTRTPVDDIADYEASSALRRDLEQLSSDAGAKLLRALGVKGDEEELRSASEKFSGHCLALTLLGSYLTDAFNGDIRFREEVSTRLAHDVRQGAHARKVMESYQTWFGEGPELSVLRMLGLFDRPADERALATLIKAPAIHGLTESLTDLSPTELRTVFARLRRAKLLSGEDPHNPGQLDTHPLVREYFGDQLRNQQMDAWKECNRRLYHYYRTLAPQLPNSFREMEPLFLAVICGCNAGLYHEALHEIYILRIQRGNDSFAANVLGARGPLLSVLVHFFEAGRWGSPVETAVEGESITAEDQLFILLQAGRYLTATRGFGAPEAYVCYERAEPLCHSLNRPRLLSVALMGQWHYSLITDTVTATLQIAKRAYSLAQEQNDARLLMGAYRVLAGTLFYLGDFESAREYAVRAVQIWRSGSVQSHPEDLDTPVVGCLCYQAKSEWHLGEVASSKATIAEAISVARKLNDMHTLASALQALLRELAAFNTGLCVITTRTPVADIADHEQTSAPRRDLEQLSSDAGAKLLHALGVKGDEAELRTASDEFDGHCLALTLLGSYLSDAYNGDIRCRSEVTGHLAHDVRQGVHARKVMESYQTWFGEGPELSVLRMLGLFDRPADERALEALLKAPTIPGLTDSLTDLSPTELRTVLARLRRARLLTGEHPHNPEHLDTHPLLREYFGEQLRSQQTAAWKECNRRLFYYYRMLAPELPNSFKDMEPLLLAVICACNAGLIREALHEVYIPRIQRGDAFFTANVLGARGPLLSVLAHFFRQGRWGLLVETAVEGQSLSAEDQLFILMQAALYLSATRGLGSLEARLCHERAESLCHSLRRPLLLYLALVGQWRYSVWNEKLTATMHIAERIYSLAQEQNDSALMIGACRPLACTFYFLGDFETARQYATRGIQIWRSGAEQSPIEEPITPAVSCLCFEALYEWHIGEIATCQTTMAEAISLAKALNDLHALVMALWYAGCLGHFERNPAAVKRLTSEALELSTRQNFATWLPGEAILRGWAHSASGDTAAGIARIENGIGAYRAIGSMLCMPYYLALKAEALHLADRSSEALKAISEAEAIVERSGERWWCAELYRLRGVFLAAMGADEAQIEASFGAAVRIAKELKSLSLENRAEGTYEEYRRQKTSGSGGRGLRLPLC